MSYTISEECIGCGVCNRICPVDGITGKRKQVQKINESLCIECGACARVCPRSGICDETGKRVKSSKKSEWFYPHFDTTQCTACVSCIEICPVSCIAIMEEPGELGPHAYPIITNSNKCIGCGFCAIECPVDAIEMIKRK